MRRFSLTRVSAERLHKVFVNARPGREEDARISDNIGRWDRRKKNG